MLAGNLESSLTRRGPSRVRMTEKGTLTTNNDRTTERRGQALDMGQTGHKMNLSSLTTFISVSISIGDGDGRWTVRRVFSIGRRERFAPRRPSGPRRRGTRRRSPLRLRGGTRARGVRQLRVDDLREDLGWTAQEPTYAGTLNLQFGDTGAIDAGSFDRDDGSSVPLVGQVTGRALNLRITLADGGVLELNGTAAFDLILCRGDASGTFGGPKDTYLGMWRTTESGSSGPSGGQSTSGGSTTTNAGGDSSNTGGNTNGDGAANGGGDAQGGTNTDGSCPAGQTRCGDTCVDPTSNNDNCRTCGFFCASGLKCVNSVCVDAGCGSDPGTGAALIVCNGICSNVATDQNNCGACGVVCASGAECKDGACACVAGMVDCAGTCIDTAINLDNCGACGQACHLAVCVGGACGCYSGQADCGSGCVDLSNNYNHCGACGQTCAGGFNRQCANGVCGCLVSTCNVGSACPTADPCVITCVDLQTDPLNCGACSHSCQGGFVGCSGGNCV